MAIYTTSQVNAGRTVTGPGISREEITITAIIAVTTAMIDNADDEVGAFYVPKGFVVTGVGMGSTALAASALVLDVGDDGDEDRLIAASTTGVAGGYTAALAYAGFLYKYTADTLVKIYVKTAATTPAAGTIKLSLTGFVDENFSTTALVAA